MESEPRLDLIVLEQMAEHNFWLYILQVSQEPEGRLQLGLDLFLAPWILNCFSPFLHVLILLLACSTIFGLLQPKSLGGALLCWLERDKRRSP